MLNRPLIRIQGSADRVFEAIRNVCGRRPYLTLQEAGEKGLLDPRLQRTVPYRPGKFPEVRLEIGIENN
jgi:hypothetical protein